LFGNIKNFFVGVWNKLFNKDQLANKLGATINVSDKMTKAIQDWDAIYKNQSSWLNSQVKSLGLGASISSEFARLVTLELESEVSGSVRAEFLNVQYSKLLENLRQQTEYALAKGGMVFKPYVADGEIKIDYVQADCFYPISFSDNGYVTEGFFVDQIKKGNYYYNKIEYRKFENGAETIKNMVFKSTTSNDIGNQISLESVNEWASLVPEITFTGLKMPLFAYFKNPMANTIEPGNPIGVSVFSRSAELIEEADKQWSRFLWENESGERAIDVDSGAFKKDEYGNMVIPSGKERLYRTLESTDNTPMYHDWSPEFRNDPLLAGLDAILKKIEFNCGLAYGALSDPQTVDKTATEVKQARQRSYSTVKDIQNALNRALEHTVYIMDVLSTLYKLSPLGSYEVTSTWDDSIIVDAEQERLRDMQEVTMGLMKNWQYRMKWYGETEEEAKKNFPDTTEDIL